MVVVDEFLHCEADGRQATAGLGGNFDWPGRGLSQVRKQSDCGNIIWPRLNSEPGLFSNRKQRDCITVERITILSAYHLSWRFPCSFNVSPDLPTRAEG